MTKGKNFISFLRKMRDHWRFGGFHQVFNLFIGTKDVYLSKYQKSNTGSLFCPCCDWHGSKFAPYFSGGYTTPNAVCPQCGSHARHRGHIEYYKNHIHLFDKKGDLLYFAPEKGILPHLHNATGLVVKTSDFDPQFGSDYSLDIMNISLPDNSFDYIICHRVIEHVSDDRKAMRELYRILKPGGMAIISVPISFNLSVTVEFGKANPLCDDHYYDYGTDFIKRIPEEFNTTEIRFTNLFDKKMFNSLGLFEDCIFECKKPL
jgi:SAM-dependent methyltransferase